jgi:hypothetical protein
VVFSDRRSHRIRPAVVDISELLLRQGDLMYVASVARVRLAGGRRVRKIGKGDKDIVCVARVVRVRRYAEGVRRRGVPELELLPQPLRVIAAGPPISAMPRPIKNFLLSMFPSFFRLLRQRTIFDLRYDFLHI